MTTGQSLDTTGTPVCKAANLNWSPKDETHVFVGLAGECVNLVAGAGFEPATFGL